MQHRVAEHVRVAGRDAPKRRPFGRLLGIRSFGRSTAAVSEVVGTVIMTGITIAAAVTFGIAVFSMPPPIEGANTSLSAFVAQTEPQTMVVLNSGGSPIPLRALALDLSVASVHTKYNVGERLDAADPAWVVRAVDGSSRTADQQFRPGDEIRFTSTSILGKALSVVVIDEARNAAIMPSTVLQEADQGAPRPVSARGITTTTMLVTLNEVVRTVAASDFTVTGTTVTNARIIWNGSVVELTINPIAPGATPTVSSVASPTGTRDLADVLLAPSVSVVSIWFPLPVPPRPADLPLGYGPYFTSPVVNVIYQTVQAKDKATRIGMNVVNPTASPLLLDRVTFTASPALGATANDKFFRTPLSMGAGSDAAFTCTWSGVGSDTVTCDPAGTITIPAYSISQVVLVFTTSKTSTDGHTIVTGSAFLTNPAKTLTQAVNVRHQSSGVHISIFALSGPGGSERAGFPYAAGGTPTDFHFRFEVIGSDAKTRARFIIPSSWTAVEVPSQSALDEVSVIVRAPTIASEGYVELSQELIGGTRDFYFRATPPAGADARVLEVDFYGSKEGSSSLAFENLLWFGIGIS